MEFCRVNGTNPSERESYRTGEAAKSSLKFHGWPQKNPGTIRIPEEDRGRENFTMTHFVDLQQSDVISEHIASLCGEAKDATYTRESDLHKWANIPGKMK
ncbi:hypothetical protein RUM43_009907 [Polyplax serrata]|uniref:Out at first protein BRICHOS-like domain-containing protein n=1 Tax=Polyplax serrata TaxID=468196 RepID=A0AAN8S4J3_POLSC